MPSCFQLYRKDDVQAGPVVLAKIDEELCAHFKQPVDPVKYLNGWYDCIGFRLATGRTFEQIREEFKENIEEEKARGNPNEGVEFYENSLQILAYLEEHYTANSFYSPFK